MSWVQRTDSSSNEGEQERSVSRDLRRYLELYEASACVGRTTSTRTDRGERLLGYMLA
jgi:hypothetical protein